jgi:salicylate hydroxylase
MHVVLAGAGIGGLTAALSLPKSVRVTLLEQAPALQEAGAGIQLSPNATRVLAGLGLGRRLASAAFEPEATEVRDAASGRLLLRQPLGATARERWGAPYLHIHRADLQGLLLEAVSGMKARELRLGAQAASAHNTAGGAVVEMADGGSLEADAVIGCDGLRSAVRASLWGAGRPRFTGQIAWRGVVEASRLPPGLIPPIAGVWTGPGRHFVHYYVRGGELVNFVGVVERPGRGEESWTATGYPAELAYDFAGWPDPVQAILSAVETVWRWPLYDRPPLARWSKGRISLLGDAAHPMLPFLAQGAAMAIEDAAALGGAFPRSPTAEVALRAYESERRARTARVQAASRRNAFIFHLPAPLGRAAFGAARLADRFDAAQGAGRFDWLYQRGPDG